MTRILWEPIDEMDDEEGIPTCYGATIRPTGESRFLWLTQFPDGWHVEGKRDPDDDLTTYAVCTSLASAKRWATLNAAQLIGGEAP